MAQFNGLKDWMFGYFVKHDDESKRQRVASALPSFAKAIQTQLQSFDPFYASYDVGTLRPEHDSCWIAFGPADNKYRNGAHQTVALFAHSLDVFVNVEMVPAVNKLRQKIKNNRQGFRSAIAGLPVDKRPFSVLIWERRQIQAELYEYRLIASLETDHFRSAKSKRHGLQDPQLGSYTFDYIEQLVQKIPYPNITVVRHINRDEAVSLGTALVNQVVGIMQEFHPLVQFLNQ